MTRMATTITNDNYVFWDESDSVLRGICMDLWKRMSNELNISYSMTTVDEWTDFYTLMEDNETDVIAHTMDETQFQVINIPE